MHFFGIGVHVLLAIYFAVHVVRMRQEMYWLLILFMFPLLGSIVYALAVWWPETRNAPALRRAGRSLRRAMDPQRRLREAQQAFAESEALANRLELADALMDANRAEAAMPHYRVALSGPYAEDPEILVRLAKSLVECDKAAEARSLLEGLIARHPEFKSADGHLTYARAVAAEGDRDKARDEFEVLVGYFPGLEACARYRLLLREWGDEQRAIEIRDEALRRIQRLPRHTLEHERTWVDSLRGL